MTWRWLKVRPGVLTLSGTPFQVHKVQPNVWKVYDGDNFSGYFDRQWLAKHFVHQRTVKLIKAGVIDDPR